MLSRLKKILTATTAAPVSNSAEIEAALAEYDVAALEAQFEDAQQRRADLLLAGTDEEILAAEADATTARLAIDRAHAAIAELNRRLVEARDAEARAAAQKQHDAAEAGAAAVAARIKADYVVHAQAIARLVEDAAAADKAASQYNAEFAYEGKYVDTPAVKLVHERIGWPEKFVAPPQFADSISLPAVDDFPGVGEAKTGLTKLARWIVYGVGNPDDYLEGAS